MPRTRVKICGITRASDALLTARLGADAIGIQFYAGSKRAIDVEQAGEIRRCLPAFVSLVGLFVNPTGDEVQQVLDKVHLDCLQFHGSESADFCARFDLPYIKALRPRQGDDVLQQIVSYPQASAILLDAWDPRQAGGTGKVCDWTVARHCVAHSDCPVILAGGLHAGNAAQAIAEVAPWALDLASGVESEPGIKDPDKLKAFFDEVNRVRI